MTARGGQLPDEARALYVLAPEEFASARNTLVRRLKQEGRADEAAVVAKLRRPRRTAWALDQLARRQPALVDEVLRTGKRLREAWAASEGRGVLDAAQADERRAVSDAVAGAVKLLAEAGVKAGDAAEVLMAETLRAAILDPEVESRLVSGTLDTDVSAPGFGVLAEGTGKPEKVQERGRGQGQRRRRAVRQRLEREARQARARAEVAAAEADAAETRARELRRRADELAASAARAEDAAKDAGDG